MRTRQLDGIESRIDDLESQQWDHDSRIDDLDDKLDDLDGEIHRLKDDLYTWNKLDTFSIPYTYEKLLIDVNSFLRTTWFPVCLKKYKNVFLPKKDIPFEINQKRLDNKTWRRNLIFRNTTFLKNARTFYELGIDLSIDIKPILIYYSSTYLYSFFMNSLACFENEKRHHGIFIEVKENNAKSIMIKLPKYGFFPRLVRTMSLLNYGSIFSDFMIDFEMKEKKINDIILHQNNDKFSIGNKEFFPLHDLFTADIKDNYERLDLEYQAYNTRSNFLNVSKLLRNHILLYVACSLARYNPGIWKEIYEGETTDYFIRLQRSIENVSDIINQISRDFNGFKKKKTRYVRIYKREH